MAVELRVPGEDLVRIDGTVVTVGSAPARTLAAGEVMTAAGWIITCTEAGDVQVDAGPTVSQAVTGNNNSVMQLGHVGDIRLG